MRRYLKGIIAVFVVVSALLTVSFYNKPAVNRLEVQTSIQGHTVSYKNKSYLERKIDALNASSNKKISALTVELSDKPQSVVMAVRANAGGRPETSLAYTARRNGETVTLTLYVNPSMFPATDKIELQRQYTQLLLLALYQIANTNEPKTPTGTAQFIADYRKSMDMNTIFEIN